MATATKELKGAVTVVKLSGAIDDSDDFGKLIGQPSGALQIFCKGVTRINSVGVKNWIKYFNGLQQQKVAFSFEEFGPALVENLNMVQNFCCGGAVISVVVPYRCAGCETSLMGTLKSDAIKAAGFKIAAVKCPKCGGQAEFDDEPDEYFAFLNR
jgi:hypothetical protein